MDESLTLQRKIQTLDSSAMAAAPEVDPDLPEELRAAMAAERGQTALPHRPANSFIPGGPVCSFIHLPPVCLIQGGLLQTMMLGMGRVHLGVAPAS